MKAFFGIAALVLLAGCDLCPEEIAAPDQRLVPAALEAPRPPPPITRIVVPSPQLRSVNGQNASSLTGAEAVLQARKSATTQPSSDAFLEATQYYDYVPGMVYSVLTSPGYLTTITLHPGENLVHVSAGETARWIVSSVIAGSPPRTMVLIKPRRPNLQTNLIIATDQRVYQLEISSLSGSAYHTSVAWNYGEDFQNGQDLRRPEPPIAEGIDPKALNFNYVILKQRCRPEPPWMPMRAFDDGRRTFIQFPPRRLVTQAPPLFVLSPGGEAQIVNYRIQGDFYLLDQLIDRAELRLGQNPQILVGIRRANIK